MRVLSPAAFGSAEEKLEDVYDCSVAVRQLGKTSQWVRYNSGITACGAQRWHLVLNILQTGQHMQIFGCRNLRIARNSAMSACTRAARWRETLTCLKDLQTAGLRPDSWSYVAVLGTVPAGSGSWPLVMRHLEVMQLYTPLELMTLTAAISACGEWQKALALFQTMIDLSIRATLVTATAVIAACARSHWQKALSSFVGLPQRSLTANEVTRASAIRACDEGQQWQAALQIFRVKVANVVLLNEAISCGQSSGNWWQALNLLCGWRRQGEHHSHTANVDEITLGAASSNCERAGEWQVALTLSGWMQDTQGVCEDGPACNMLISGCGRGAVWNRALQLMSLMPARRLTPTDISRATSISACGRCKEWQSALWLLRAPRPRRLSDDACGASINACEIVRYWSGALELLQRMRLFNLEPDVVKRSSALSACQGNWLAALALLEQMILRAELGIITCAAVLTACSVARQWLQCLQVLQQMRDLRMAIDFVACCDAAQACDGSGLGQAAVPQLLQEVRSSLLLSYAARSCGSRGAFRVLQPA
ncbi:MRL1 [Symbiodinium necroappetens]|uniref:MRL1 protein n=1 Tax=Symbiodinium necroappetens TaxID=1628268 RepID=A0A813CD61_9DINO|nr:MRL1 [Symbiodinium necroappetens]